VAPSASGVDADLADEPAAHRDHCDEMHQRVRRLTAGAHPLTVGGFTDACASLAKSFSTEREYLARWATWLVTPVDPEAQPASQPLMADLFSAENRGDGVNHGSER
jgi:hypothetical protein